MSDIALGWAMGHAVLLEVLLVIFLSPPEGEIGLVISVAIGLLKLPEDWSLAFGPRPEPSAPSVW
jgi:hypothetical protein